MLLFAGALAFNTQLANSELIPWIIDDGGLPKRNLDPEYTQRTSIRNWLPQANGSKTIRFTATENDYFHVPSSSFKWLLPNETEWNEFAYVSQDSAEVVVGLSNRRIDDYLEVIELVSESGGQYIESILMDGNIQAIVADVPLQMLSFFADGLEVRGLARYFEPNIRFEADLVPNDPNWLKQWGPQKIEADWAWNTTIGDSSILVAVVDTGIDFDHPDLADNYVSLGYDWVNNDSNPMDDNGHGTHCAGVIAAVANNNIGIAGIAQVQIMAEKGLGADGSGRVSDLANAIVHAVDQGADVISCSWGGYVESTLLHEAVRYAYDHGVLVVAAAGNDAVDIKNYPAAYDEVFAVTATDQDDNFASFTNFGNWVEAAAPGVQIYSTIWDDSYAYKSGTSMAAPHVSGVAALIWSRFPNMTRDQVWAQLQYTAEDIGNLGFDDYYGYGRINARKAVEQAPAEHDVLILNWKTPSYVRLGDAAVINTTLLNMGARNESNITVQLLANGSVVDSVPVGFLASGESISVSCSWTPTIEGTYNITSYVVPLIGETVVNNNALSTQIKARVPQVIRVPDDYGTIQKAIDAAFEGDTVFVASGTYYENVWIDKDYLNLEGENQKNTIIDGQGRADVILVTANDITIKEFTLKNSASSLFYGGIYVMNAKRTAISEVTTLYNYHGIFLKDAVNATLRNNNMTRNVYNFGVDGNSLQEFVHDIDFSNSVDGKPIYYWINEHDRQIPSDAGYVAAVNSSNIVIKDLNLTKNFDGALFAYTSNSLIEHVNATENYFGIHLECSNNNSVHSSFPINNHDGIYLYESESNKVEDNRLINNTYGIKLQDSSYNVFRYNNMTANEYNFGVTGSYLPHFVQDIDISNIVDGKPVYYWVNQQHREIPTDGGYVAVVNSTDIIVRGLNLTNNMQGVLFAFTTQSLIEETILENNAYNIYIRSSSSNEVINSIVTSKGKRGVQLVNSSDNVINNNIISNNYVGVGMWLKSNNNTVSGNLVSNGTNEGAGLYLDGSESNNVSNNVLTSNEYGMILYKSTTNTIRNNYVANNSYGILLSYSSSNVLRNNSMTENGYNFGIEGTSVSHYVNDVDASNVVDKKPIYYWINKHDAKIPRNAGYVAIINSTSITVENLNVTNNLQGILFAYTINSTITNTSVSHNFEGIYLWNSKNNTIRGNEITKNEYEGIVLQNSDDTAIHGNTFTNNLIGVGLFTLSYKNVVCNNTLLDNVGGIMLYYSDENIISNNKVTGGTEAPNGLVGISLTTSRRNTLSGNSISTNQFLIGAGILLELSSSNNTVVQNLLLENLAGIWLRYSNDSVIYHNSFLNNSIQAFSLSSSNVWDDGYPSGGNYWNTYTGVDLYGGPYQNLTGSDGIGDTPYVIDEDNQDRYPLLKSWGPVIMVFDITFDNIVYSIKVVSNSTISDFAFTQALKQVSFNATGPDGTIGFCSVTVPKQLLYGEPWTVLIDGTPTLLTTTENATHSKLYFTYSHSTHKVQIIGTYVFTPPPPLSTSISPLSSSIFVGQSITLTSTVSGGYAPYSYQWYLNGNPVSGATSASWTFTPITSNIYYVYLKVTDTKGNTAQSETAKITVAAVPVGGYTVQIDASTSTKFLKLYVLLTAILITIFTTIKHNITRKTKKAITSIQRQV